MLLGGGDLLRVDAHTAREIHETIAAAGHYWTALPNDANAANGALRVVENLKIPVRSIAVIMLLFIIAVGPLNIFLLSRKNKRTWMLWTIPAISLATTLLIFAYSLLREGIVPDARIAGLTLLDQPGHHAATTGAAGFYCPLTPSDGLRFDSQTEASPLVAFNNDRSGSAREVNWTQTQHFQRGWVAARVPAHFHIRKSEPRRERLEWQKTSKGWQIINGLGAPIKSLWVADQDMKFYLADEVAAGQTADLVSTQGSAVPGKRGARVFLRDLGCFATSPGPDVLEYLQPGSYIAVLDGNPFIENALGTAASAKRTRSSAVVYGLLETPATR